MMTCRELTEFLSDYVAGELPQEVSSTFEFHLKLCRDCHRFMVQFRETVRAGQTAFEPAPSHPPLPEDLVSAVMAAIRETPPTEDA